MQTQEGDKSRRGCGLRRGERDKRTIYRLLSSAELFHISLHPTVLMTTPGRAVISKAAHIQLTAVTHKTSPSLSAGSPCAARGKQWGRMLVSGCGVPLPISGVYVFNPNTPGTALSFEGHLPKMTWFHSFIGSLSSVSETGRFFFPSSGFRNSETNQLERSTAQKEKRFPIGLQWV